ncbi:MAG: thymidine phosphorylase family protein [Candidatus Woesearchaeota archaeon]
MKLKVRNIPISTGNANIAVINEEDAIKFDLFPEDRIKVIYGKNDVVVSLDITKDKSMPPGYIYVMEEVTEYLHLKNNKLVKIEMAQKPISTKYIRKKLSGGKLTKKEIYTIIKDIVKGNLTDIELTYFVSGCYSHELSIDEITYMVKALVDTGQRFRPRKKIVVDKHCIGGVPNNRTTIIVVPIIAAYGLCIPKTSSRAITSPAGTADTLEVLTNVNLDIKKMSKVVKKTNGCLAWGGSLNLAPADDKIIRIEYPIFIDTTGLLMSSVLAKKYSVSATHVIIDIPYGPGAKVETRVRALKLKKLFELMGRRLGIKIRVLLTDGSQPVGNGIGPLLECIDCIKVLRNKKDAPQDLKEKSIYLAGQLLNLSGVTKSENDGEKIARDILESGRAYKKFIEIIKAQGMKKMPNKAKLKLDFRATKTGKIKEIHNSSISKIARLCGAPKTKEAGLYLYKKVGDSVKKGEKIITLYANNKDLLRYAKQKYLRNLPIIIE